jgi:Cytochrome P450
MFEVLSPSNLTCQTSINTLAYISLVFFWYKTLRVFFRLSHVPGPRSYAISKWRLAFDDWRGIRTRTIHQLHQQYGPAIRIGPSELSFSSLLALRTIYGAGSGFERTSFYRMFDVYGHQNLFTFASVKAHSERKKLLNHAYSKSSILKVSAIAVEEKVWHFLQLLESEPEVGSEIFGSLHYFALDNITEFLYGKFGSTNAMGRKHERGMISDILDPKRRKLAWFSSHLPRYTKFLSSRTGLSEKVVSALGLLPQQKPTVYTGIRNHALRSWERFKPALEQEKADSAKNTIIQRLWQSHTSNKDKKDRGLSDLEIASECADHLLAGVDTTSDTLMFLIWALSLPPNIHFQDRLIREVKAMSESDLDARGIPTAEAAMKLPYLDAVLTETLRLYSPLPASEPRSLPTDTVIGGLQVPAGTVVSMSPYTLHRNADIFPDPLVFNPERWLGGGKEVGERKKWFWAFSSGGRMCIGIQ